MKRNLVKTFSLLSLAVLLVMVTVFSGIMKARALEASVFGDMYDSNAVFLEEVLRLEQNIAINDGLDSQQLLEAVKGNRLTDLEISDTEMEIIDLNEINQDISVPKGELIFIDEDDISTSEHDDINSNEEIININIAEDSE